MHFPAGRPGRTLSVILLCDARTFLTIIPFGNISRDCPAQSRILYIIFVFLSSRRRVKKQNVRRVREKYSKIDDKIPKNGVKTPEKLNILDKFDKNFAFLLQT